MLVVVRQQQHQFHASATLGPISWYVIRTGCGKETGRQSFNQSHNMEPRRDDD